MSLREQSQRLARISRGARRGLRVAGLSLGLTFALAAAARAQPARSELVAHYSAEGDCPSRADFERRVRARLSTSAHAALRFDVRLARSAGAVRGILQVVGRSSGARELSAPSCAEAAEALALVAALMLSDPGADPPGAEAPRAPRTGRRPAAPPAGEPGSKGDSAQSATTPSVPDAADGEDTDAVVSSITAGSELDTDTAPRSISTAVPPRASGTANNGGPPREPFFRDWRIRGSIGGLFAWGMAHQLRAGPNIAAGISARAHGVGPRYALELGARGAFPHQVRVPEGKASFRWLAFTTSLCIEGPEHRFNVAGCALLETGWTDARSKDGVTPRERTRFWGAAGPALVASALFHPQFGVRLSGELLAVLVRDRFFLADRLLYSVPPLAFRAGLSLYYSLW